MHSNRVPVNGVESKIDVIRLAVFAFKRLRTCCQKTFFFERRNRSQTVFRDLQRLCRPCQGAPMRKKFDYFGVVPLGDVFKMRRDCSSRNRIKQFLTSDNASYPICLSESLSPSVWN